MLPGRDGFDTLIGGLGDDVLYGGRGDDWLEDGSGSDQVLAESGDDWLLAGTGTGDDLYDGGPGDDWADFEDTTQGVQVDLASGTASGSEIGNDAVLNIENLLGGAGQDQLIGDDGWNYLAGLAGDDSLTGGAGSDVFALAPGGGTDTVQDFIPTGADSDVIQLEGFGFASASEVLTRAAQTGPDTTIDLGSGTSAILAGIDISSLTTDAIVLA